VRVDNRDHFRKYLLDNGVETAVHYATPPHRQPCYAEYSHLSLPITDEIARTVVSLPITRTTSLADAATIAAIITGYKS
jgi:dTDP-4-amino-4,6-dideoxygalactose transaminase